MTKNQLQDATPDEIVRETHEEVMLLQQSVAQVVESIKELKDGKWGVCSRHDAKINSIQAEVTEHKTNNVEQFREVWARFWWFAGIGASLLIALGAYSFTH